MTAPSKPRGLDNLNSAPAPSAVSWGLGLRRSPAFIFENALQIVATRDHVVLHTEYGDDVRIIPLKGAHQPAALTSRLGDSSATGKARP